MMTEVSMYSPVYWLFDLACRILGHKWEEEHMREVVCTRCRRCRGYTEEDERNLMKLRERL